MAKDPAFLFYSKDWIEGTAEMTPQEKGVYIDLLAHQHQKKGLPTETNRLCKLCGLSEPDFLNIWEHLKSKFYTNSVNRLVNEKLTKVTTERSEKGLKNKITGTFASVIRLSKESYENKNIVKKMFKYEEFTTISDHLLTETITEWFVSRLKSIVNGNANENYIIPVNNTALIPEMFSIFKLKNITYPGDVNKDFNPLGNISRFIHNQLSLTGDVTNHKSAIIKEWTKLCEVIADDGFYKLKSLSVISNQIQEIYQIKINGKPVKPNGNKANSGSLAHVGKTINFDQP